MPGVRMPCAIGSPMTPTANGILLTLPTREMPDAHPEPVAHGKGGLNQATMSGEDVRRQICGSDWTGCRVSGG
jgi:hypothetical protein